MKMSISHFDDKNQHFIKVMPKPGFASYNRDLNPILWLLTVD